MTEYIFPNFMAKIMAKVDLRTQYEASMLSMTFILIGLMISVIYIYLYVQFPLWYKITIIINGIADFVFLSSFIVTTYQQYITLMETLKFQKELKGGIENAKEI